MRLRLVRNKQGQFIIIAALLIAIMIISAGAVMFSAVTYFTHERWEEYVVVIDGVEEGTARVLEVSLANYTLTGNSNILKTNLDSWRQDVKKAYSGFGTILNYSLATGSYSVYGMSLNYVLGLNRTWNQPISYSAANATVSLNITSVGLTGYRFSSTVFLKMNITDALWYKGQGNNNGQIGIRVVMYKEGNAFITNLQTGNFVLFQIGSPGVNKTFSFYRYYEETLSAFVYELRYEHSSKNKPASVIATVGVVDARGIKVTGKATLIPVDAP